jgi:conjugative transposon TraN protein
MKLQLIKSILAALLLSMASISNAQVQPKEAIALGEIVPYQIEVAYDKTSHIIFPAGIRYVDLGSDNIVAGKAQDADNVLRVKASVQGFEQETNFSVITEDGQFYSFNVCYCEAPQVLGHNLVKGIRQAERFKSADIRFEELGTSPASLAGLVMEALYERDRKPLKHVRSESYGIEFSLKGLYIHNGKYYFHTELENTTYVPFAPDYIKFRIIDRKVAKRTVIQERTVDPLRTYRPLLPVQGNSKEKNIFLLDVFTLTKGQMLEIEVIERNGGRGQVLKIKNSDLVKAQPLDKLRVKL